MNENRNLKELSFTVSGRVARPLAEVYEAVADPAQLSPYFTTGGARGRLEAGNDVEWKFADSRGDAFPVTVIDATPPRKIVVQWENDATTHENGTTTAVFEFEPIDDDSRTLVTITESSWQPTAEGEQAAFSNCEGWTGMLIALKAWLEHGINLRDGFYN